MLLKIFLKKDDKSLKRHPEENACQKTNLMYEIFLKFLSGKRTPL